MHPLNSPPNTPIRAPGSDSQMSYPHPLAGVGEVGTVGGRRGKGRGWAEGTEFNSCFLPEGFPHPQWSLINPPDQITPLWEEKKKCVFILGHKTSILTSHR